MDLKNHSVVQGDYYKACQPAGARAFYSGFIPSRMGMAVSSPSAHQINSDFHPVSGAIILRFVDRTRLSS